jgi:hypothetical protein
MIKDSKKILFGWYKNNKSFYWCDFPCGVNCLALIIEYAPLHWVSIIWSALIGYTLGFSKLISLICILLIAFY